MNGNARIKSTMLGYEDHGIMTCFLMLEQDGCGQGFGGYGLDGPYDEKKKQRLDSRLAGFWIRRILEVTGVDKWEKVPGNFVRVKGDHGHIEAIGHIIKDIWFYPEKEIKENENHGK